MSKGAHPAFACSAFQSSFSVRSLWQWGQIFASRESCSRHRGQRAVPPGWESSFLSMLKLSADREFGSKENFSGSRVSLDAVRGAACGQLVLEGWGGEHEMAGEGRRRIGDADAEALAGLRFPIPPQF